MRSASGPQRLGRHDVPVARSRIALIAEDAHGSLATHGPREIRNVVHPPASDVGEVQPGEPLEVARLVECTPQGARRTEIWRVPVADTGGVEGGGEPTLVELGPAAPSDLAHVDKQPHVARA